MPGSFADFLEVETIEFPFKKEEGTWGKRTVVVELTSLGAGGSFPEIDPSTFRILSPQDYLSPSDVHREGDIVVFTAELHTNLLNKSNLYDLIKDPITFKVEIQEKTPKAGGKTRRFKGKFKAKIERPVEVGWQCYEVGNASNVARSENKGPFEFDPDGKNSFVLEVWASEWNHVQKIWEQKSRTHDFSHWLAPGDPFVNIKVIGPNPLPWKAGAGSSQETTTWESKRMLPDPSTPGLREFPLDIALRVKAWKKGDILGRISAQPYLKLQADAKEVAETDVPIRLCRDAEIVVKFEPEEGRTYAGVTFKQKEEFVADAVDNLTFVAYARRKGMTEERVYEKVEIKLSLSQGTGSFTLQVDEAFKEPGKRKATVGATAPILAEEGSTGASVSLKVEAFIKGKGGDEIQLVDPIEVPLAPLLPKVTTKLTASPTSILGDGIDTTKVKFMAACTVDGATIDILEGVKPTFTVGPEGEQSGEMSSVSEGGKGAQIVVKAKWAEVDTTLAVGVKEATVSIKGRQGDVAIDVKDATQKIAITGASGGGEDEITINHATGVPKTADADGTSKVTIKPNLTLFGKPQNIEITDEEFETDFFEKPAAGGTGTPAPAGSLRLRCKFHLEFHGVMKDVGRTGQKVTKIRYLRRFKDGPYASRFASGYPDGQKTEIEIAMRPSYVDLGTPKPESLGWDDTKKQCTTSAEIKATVKSVGGKSIGKSAIETDYPNYASDWRLCFRFNKPANRPWIPTKEYLAMHGLKDAWIGGASYFDPEGTPNVDVAIPVVRVDDSGNVVFKIDGTEVDPCTYDHNKHFSGEKYEPLKGNGSEVKVRFTSESSDPWNDATRSSGEKTIRIAVDEANALIGYLTATFGTDAKQAFAASANDPRVRWFIKNTHLEGLCIYQDWGNREHDFNDDQTSRIERTATRAYYCHDFAWRPDAQKMVDAGKLKGHFEPNPYSAQVASGAYVELTSYKELKEGDIVSFCNETMGKIDHSALVYNTSPISPGGEKVIWMLGKDVWNSLFKHRLGPVWIWETSGSGFTWDFARSGNYFLKKYARVGLRYFRRVAPAAGKTP